MLYCTYPIQSQPLIIGNTKLDYDHIKSCAKILNMKHKSKKINKKLFIKGNKRQWLPHLGTAIVHLLYFSTHYFFEKR